MLRHADAGYEEALEAAREHGRVSARLTAAADASGARQVTALLVRDLAQVRLRRRGRGAAARSARSREVA